MTSRVSWIWDSGPVRGLPAIPFVAVALGVLWLARPLDSRLAGWMAASKTLDMRAEATAAFAGVAVVASVLMPTVYSLWLPAMWLALAGAVLTSRTRSLGAPWAAVSIGTILVAHLVAIPFASAEQVANTAGHAILMLPLAALYVIGPQPRVWAWLAGFGLIQAGAVAAGSLAGAIRAGGLTPHNPNLAAGVLVFTAIYFVHRRSPLALIPLAAILFTGSRWASVVALVIILAMLAKDRITVRRIIGAGVIVVALGAASQWGPVHDGYRLNGLVGLAGQAVHDASVRLELSPLPSFIPQGSVPSRQHSTVIRIAVETGILSAVAWLALTLAGLVAKPPNLRTPGPLMPQESSAGPENETRKPHRNRVKNVFMFHRWLLPPPRSGPPPVDSHIPLAQEPQNNKPKDSKDRSLHRWLLLAVVGLGAMDYYIWLAQLAPVWWLLVGALVNQPFRASSYDRASSLARALGGSSAALTPPRLGAPPTPLETSQGNQATATPPTA